MNPLLREFRDRFLEQMLELLWRQWTALGMAGHAEGSPGWVVDPEALLLATSTFGRFEPRLFDEALDCLRCNGWILNAQRLGTLLRDEEWAGGPVLAAVAGYLSRGTDALKWRRLAQHLPGKAEPQGLFYFKDGRPLPLAGEPERHFAGYGFHRDALRVRDHSLPFRPRDRGNLLMQLRALLGVNVRAEIVAYLLTHEAGHPAEIARAACFHKRSIQNALVEMHLSGVVEARSVGREKHYWLRAGEWRALLQRPGELPLWASWPPLLSAVEQVWRGIHDPKLEALDPLLLSSALRQLMLRVRPGIERAGFARNLTDDRHYLGEAYLPVFLSDIGRLLDVML